MKIGRLTMALVLMASGFAVAAVPGGAQASAASCLVQGERAGDDSGSTSAVAVTGVLATPFSGEITGSDISSAADIYIGSEGDYVQVGWYLGSASQLAYVTTPHMFWGEYNPASLMYGEVLTEGPALSWGTYYSFEIAPAGNLVGKYDFFLQGMERGSTAISHFSEGLAAFNGETNDSCTIMRARAFHAASPFSTLEYKTSKTGSWLYFNDSRWASAGYTSISGGGQGTDWAYGGSG
jgi:hypothetical protein